MEVRVGAFVLSVASVFQALALVFFLRLAWIGIYPGVASSRAQAWRVLAVSCLTGVLGALAYGQVGPWLNPAPWETRVVPVQVHVQAGSFGGMWGVLVGGAIASHLERLPWKTCLDQIVPAVLVSGAIARTADLFAGTNPGFSTLWVGIPAFRYWGLYDIGALGLILLLVRHQRWQTAFGKLPGGDLTLFLMAYGLMRFVLEFARDTIRPLGPFTVGQALALVQLIVGSFLLVRIRQGYFRARFASHR